jgi:uncharacterized protein
VIASRVRAYVHEQCQRENNLLSPAFFDQHILPVAEYGEQLARQLGADREIVGIAAYLHDISAVQDIHTIPDHPRLGAEIAAGLLAQWSCPPSQIVRVRQCISTHSAPLQIGEASLEDVCLSNADAMALITKLPYWFYFAFVVRKLGFLEGKEWLRQKVDENWEALIDPARKLIHANYARAKEWLE